MKPSRKNMEIKICYVDRQSNTSADTLLAVGLASLLGAIHNKIYQTSDGIMVQDGGSCYGISLPYPIDSTNLPSISDISIVQPLDSQKQREKKGKRAIDGFDYDMEMENSRSHRMQIKELTPELQTPDARLKHAPGLADSISNERDTRLGHYQAINQMKIASSFNELVLRWADLTEEQMQWHITLLLDLFSHPNNQVTEAVSAWQKFAKMQGISGKALVTALQIVNPTTGKGANREKASELTIGNQDSFWLLELLKFKGFMDAAAPLVIKESKDRKTYVLQPRQIELNTLQFVMKEFRASFWPTTAIKLDILAPLRFAQVIVRQHRTVFQHLTLRRRKQIVASIVQGFDVTSYKDLGSAYATMNLASINIPVWLPPLDTPELVKKAEELLDEHVQIIQGIRNNNGDEGAEEYELLHFYRDFLSGNDLRFFWKFTTAYSSYLISTREKKRTIHQFTTKGLEQLLMYDQSENVKFTEIIQKDGFKNIANAIRQASVGAQYRHSQQDKTYEIHYGLGQRLMQKSRYTQAFMVELCDFLREYNAETARVAEMLATRHKQESDKDRMPTPKLRFSVASKDIDDISELLDNHGSELIAAMLVAYGYAFDSNLIMDNNRNKGK